MANALTSALQRGYRRFFRNYAATPTFYSVFTDALVIDEPLYTESDIYGLTTFASVSASPTYQILAASASSATLAAYEGIVAVEMKESRDIPSLLSDAGNALGRLAALTVDNAWITALTTLDATTHPENGGSYYSAVGGGTVYYCDAFSVDPPTVAVSTFVQQNLFTDTFSPDAVSDALAARHQYLDKSGNRTTPEGKPRLVVPVAMQTDAIDLISLQGPLYDGSGVRSGSFKDRIASIETLPGVAADDEDWWVIWTSTWVDDEGRSHRRCPVMPVLRGGPRITYTESADSHYLYVKGYQEYTIAYATWEGDIQLHRPA